jgi:hypothetical protein
MDFKIVHANRVQIYLLFYRPRDDDPFLNRLVAYFDGPFCHVEMAFSESRFGEEPWERELWGSSIYQGETVFFKPKTYARDGYYSIALDVTVAQMYKIKSYCKREQERAVPFSREAMYASYIPFYQIVRTEGTFCSKHVAAALQYGGVSQVQDINPSLMTPSKLHKLLSNQSLIVQVVPAKMHAKDTSTKWTATMVKTLL